VPVWISGPSNRTRLQAPVYRTFHDPADGALYRASISPMERKGSLGVDSRLNALVVESDAGEWIGSAPLYHNVTLDSLTTEDLLRLLN
jgi:hypothetical protein